MKYRYLMNIDSPADLKKLAPDQLKVLAEEIRDYIIQVVSATGGHLAPSLGAVDLAIAVHYVFDSPRDKIIWDVGHQAYAHKILTGRREEFKTNRCLGGISGFPSREESPSDSFGVGHASTSISAGYGMVCARDTLDEDYSVVSIIGDGSMTGGLAFEGLNNAGGSKKDFIVILNDNQMSISPNVGALHNFLTKVLTHPAFGKLKDEIWDIAGKLPSGDFLQRAMGRIDSGLKAIATPGQLFESFGFDYIGPVDGHNIEGLTAVLNNLKDLKGPRLLHVLTHKGRGYKFAEEDSTRFHGLGAFDKYTGKSNGKKAAAPSYTSVFGKTLVELAAKNERIVGITAAMAPGTGLTYMQDEFPDRFYDVGIAEAHAVTFSAGLAVQGLKPFVAIYSTFFQRALDQVIHDVALQKLPVVFALDRAGVVGEDGPTHHGCFDLSYLRGVPNLMILAPRDEAELRDMMYTASRYEAGPVVIRYPRGQGEGVEMRQFFREIPIGKGEKLKKGDDAVILAVGPLVNQCVKAAKILEKEDISLSVIDMKFVKPLDEEIIVEVNRNFNTIITVEENAVNSGFGSAVADFVSSFEEPPRVIKLGIPDKFIGHGPRVTLLENIGLNAKGIASTVRKLGIPEAVK